MSYLTKWTPLKARITGLVQAGHLHAAFRDNDSFRRDQRLRTQCAQVLAELEEFRDEYLSALPAAAAASILDFSEKVGTVLRDDTMTRDLAQEATRAGLVALALLETELSFLLAGSQEAVRSLSARAFVHLQRLIVADPDEKAKWQRAFAGGETQCEKLGAAHLLLHGLFAFKVSGAGERTDLVFNDRIQSLADAERYAEGIVLTEWKKAASPADAASQSEQGRRQAARYTSGVLGSIELVNYRYVVLVSEDFLPDLPGEIVEGGITYRQVNIAVNPSVPSRQS